MKKDFWVIVICAAGISLFAMAQNAYCVVVDKIVAVVNGEVITQSEVAQYLLPIYEQYKKEYTGRNLDEKMIEAEDSVLKQLIEDKLILSEAKRAGIRADDDEVEDRLKRIIKDRFGSEEKFREILTVQNMSVSDMKEALKADVIKSKIVRQKVGSRVTITPSETRRYYDEHISEFAEPERAEVFNILIRKKERRDDEAKELIKKIKTQLDKGGDFEEITKKYSEGPNAKDGGGLGLIRKGEMMQQIDETIFALKPGEVSDIVETSIGYHIFKVTQVLPATSKDFDSANEDIVEAIYNKKIQKNLEKWLKELRENAYISIK